MLPHTPAAAGRHISHYRIDAKLGQGGMGVVYRAFDTHLHRPVALKVLPPDVVSDPVRRRRFEQEALAASAISNGHVAHIYDFGQSDGEYFLAMEYVEGKTLEAMMLDRRVELPQVLSIGVQIADALEVAHSKGIIHRDIKPANVMITERAEAKVLDFGIARISMLTNDGETSPLPTLTATKPGEIVGTVRYMSPEQALGRDVDVRSDIFSFGAVLYEMLTGCCAFSGDSLAAVLISVTHTDPTPIEAVVPGVPPKLADVVRRCLAKDRDHRYASSAELLADLRDVQRLYESERLVPPPRPRHLPRRFVYASLLALVIVAAGIVKWLMDRGPQTDSVAILPFVNASADPDLDYLSDGLTESIINDVSRLQQLRVISRTSTFSLKGRKIEPQRVAKQFHVRTVLTGNITVRDSSLRVSLELTDGTTNKHLWGKQYSRPVAAAFSMHEEIANDVANQLRSDLSREQRQDLQRQHTDSDEAYRLFLKGRYHWNKRTVNDLKTSIQYFQDAIDRDPTYALAYAGLADAFMLLSNVMPPAEAFAKSAAAAQKAIAIDHSLAEPYATLGYIAMHHTWKWQQVEANLSKAIALNPNYPSAHSLYGRYLSIMGRFPQSVEAMQRARDLDPLAPGIATGVGLCYYFGRKYDEAITAYKAALDLNPRFTLALLDIGDAYARKMRFAEAFDAFDKALGPNPADAGGIAQRAHASALAGRKAEALAAITRLEEIAGQRYVSPYHFALVYAGLNDTEATLRYLERGFNERTSPMVFLAVEPAFDGVRAQPRYQSIVRRMGLLGSGS